MKTHHSPLGDPNERMTVTKLQRKDCVAKVAPVDDDLGSSHPGDKPDNRKGRDARRVLAFGAAGVVFSRTAYTPHRTTYLHKYELGRMLDRNRECIEDLHNLAQDF